MAGVSQREETVRGWSGSGSREVAFRILNTVSTHWCEAELSRTEMNSSALRDNSES